MASSPSLPANIRPSPSFPLNVDGDGRQPSSQGRNLQSLLHPSRHALATTWSRIRHIQHPTLSIKTDPDVRGSVSSSTPLRRESRTFSQCTITQSTATSPVIAPQRCMSTTVYANTSLSLPLAGISSADSSTIHFQRKRNWRSRVAGAVSLQSLRSRRQRRQQKTAIATVGEQFIANTASSTPNVTDATLRGASYFLERDYHGQPVCCIDSSEVAPECSPSAGAGGSSQLRLASGDDIRIPPSFSDYSPEQLAIDADDAQKEHNGCSIGHCQSRPTLLRSTSSLEQLVRRNTPPPTPLVTSFPLAAAARSTSPSERVASGNRSVANERRDDEMFVAADGKRYPRVTVNLHKLEFLPSEARRVDIRTMDDVSLQSRAQVHTLGYSLGDNQVHADLGGDATVSLFESLVSI